MIPYICLLHVRAVTASATNSSSLDRSGLLNTEPVFFFHAELPTGDKCGQQKPITGGFGSEYQSTLDVIDPRLDPGDGAV